MGLICLRGMNDDAMGAILAEHFAFGLRSRTARNHLLNCRPGNLFDAIACIPPPREGDEMREEGTVENIKSDPFLSSFFG